MRRRYLTGRLTCFRVALAEVHRYEGTINQFLGDGGRLGRRRRLTPGQFAGRYESVVHAPVLGPNGQVLLIARCPEELTERMRTFMSALAADAEHEGPD